MSVSRNANPSRRSLSSDTATIKFSRGTISSTTMIRSGHSTAALDLSKDQKLRNSSSLLALIMSVAFSQCPAHIPVYMFAPFYLLSLCPLPLSCFFSLVLRRSPITRPFFFFCSCCLLVCYVDVHRKFVEPFKARKGYRLPFGAPCALSGLFRPYVAFEGSTVHCKAFRCLLRPFVPFRPFHAF